MSIIYSHKLDKYIDTDLVDSDELEEMEFNGTGVNDIKMPKNPVDGEYKRQKNTKQGCRHLKGFYSKIVPLIDYQNDRIIDHEETACVHCDKILTHSEIKEVERTLEKFKKLR